MSEEATLIISAGKWLKEHGVVFEQIEGGKYLCNTTIDLLSQLQTVEDGQPVIYCPVPKENISWKLCTKTQRYSPPLPHADKPADELTDEEKAENREEFHRRIRGALDTLEARTARKNKLWQMVKKYIWQHTDLPDPRLYDVLTAWIFATWVNELWDTAPYVFFMGAKASGKTRALATLQNLCYRGKMTISSTPAALFRTIEKHNVTPFLDEAEVYNQESKLDIIACLNAGYKRDSGKVERYQGDSAKGDVVTFRVFGFKAIAGTEGLKKTLESRSIIVKMAKNTRDLAVVMNERGAQILRNGLLLWRFETLHAETERLKAERAKEIEAAKSYDLPSFEQFEDFEQFERFSKPSLELPPEFAEMKNSRVVELFMPLYVVSEGEARQNILSYSKDVFDEQKREEATSDEAQIIRAIMRCFSLVDNGVVALKDIVATFNEDREPNERWKSRRLSKESEKFGLEKDRTSTRGDVGFKWDTKKLRELCNRYGIDADLYLGNEPETVPPEQTAAMFKKDSTLNVLFSQETTANTEPTVEAIPDPDQLPDPSLSVDLGVLAIKTAKSITRLQNEDIQKGLCPICNETRVNLVATVTFSDETWCDCCKQCAQIVETKIKREKTTQ